METPIVDYLSASPPAIILIGFVISFLIQVGKKKNLNAELLIAACSLVCAVFYVMFINIAPKEWLDKAYSIVLGTFGAMTQIYLTIKVIMKIKNKGG